ncbi:MAG: HAD-IIA family hydrolase [Nocardioides sp.]
MLEPLATSLVEAHDLAMFDLDGVVYIGVEAVPGSPEQLARVRDAGIAVAYVTNNASRPPEAVVEKLARIGVPAEPGDVVTSAQAAAHLLAERYGAGAPIAFLGAAGLETALAEAGLTPSAVDEDSAVALATGYGPDVVWRDVMRAAVRVREGLPWIASNADLSLPTKFGTAPGHGVMVEMIERFSGKRAEVAGKPQKPLLEETIRRVGGDAPLMVGDRLDTDIEGAFNAGVPSLLVMTGVTGVAELVAATPELRPTYLAADLGGLFTPHPAPARDQDAWTCGGWRSRIAGGRLVVEGDGTLDDWWRSVAAAAWTHLDDTGAAIDATGMAPPSDARAASAGNLAP